MTQRRKSIQVSTSSIQRSLLVQGISWLGSLGILSSGLVAFAQSPDASEAIIPSAQDLLMPAESSPQPTAPVVVEPEPAAPTVTQPPAASPSPSQASSPPAADAPTIVVPGLSSDAPITADTLNQPDSAPTVEQNSYIDSTDYSIGATQRYGQPAVVLSERSTGCQATVANGQNVPASICNAQPQNVAASRNGGSMRLGPVSIGPTGVTFGSNAPSGREFFLEMATSA
jgi:hypothetical protein